MKDILKGSRLYNKYMVQCWLAGQKHKVSPFADLVKLRSNAVRVRNRMQALVDACEERLKR